MENPFETIMEKLNELEQQLNGLHKAILADSPKKNDHAEDLVNITQIAAFLKLSKATIYSKVSRRELPYYKLGKRLFFSKKEITELIMSNKGKTLQEIEDEVHTYLIKPKRRRN
jgi:excisionase family DNA binding protein